MSKVILDLTVSLDGFIAGPNVSLQNPLGEGGMRLHDWMFVTKYPADMKLKEELLASVGAVLVGKHTYDVGINSGWEGVTPFNVPAFVICKTPPQNKPAGFIYVTDGIESAFKQAKSAAGDKNVWLMGGANLIQQYIKAGLVDEMHLHIAPVLLGVGTRLFDHIGTEHIELENIGVSQTPAATHLRLRVIK